MALVGAKDRHLKVQDMHGSTLERLSDPSKHDSSVRQRERSNESDALQAAATIDTSQPSRTHYQSIKTEGQKTKQDKVTKIVKVQYPLKLDQTCLSCQTSGHDMQHVLYLFKIACIAYEPSSVKYRDRLIPRDEVISLRSSLIDKCFLIAQTTPLFKQSALYPKRYFDDLVLEDSLMQ